MTKDDDDDTQVYLSAQPKREWVGLTDEEYQKILVEHDGGGLILFYHLLEVKLREKNHG